MLAAADAKFVEECERGKSPWHLDADVTIARLVKCVRKVQQQNQGLRHALCEYDALEPQAAARDAALHAREPVT